MELTKRVIVCRRITEESRNRLLHQGIYADDLEVVKINFVDDSEIIRTINETSSPIVFTSKNGVKAIAQLEESYDIKLFSKECYCIAPVTRDFALLSGFRPKGEGKDALELAQSIVNNGEKKVCHSTAINRREELYKRLKESEIEIVPIISYQKQLKAIKTRHAEMVMFFSPSQVDGYLLKQEMTSDTMAFCIGDTTANYLRIKGHEKIVLSKKSTEKSLIESVIRYCKTNE